MNTTHTPKVGDGATMIAGSDCYPFTIINIVSDKTMVIQRDTYKLVSGNVLDGSAEWTYSPNSNGDVYIIKKAKNGHFYTRGGMKTGTRVGVSGRSYYYDPHF